MFVQKTRKKIENVKFDINNMSKAMTFNCLDKSQMTQIGCLFKPFTNDNAQNSSYKNSLALAVIF
jgi:hypothetical protein